MTLLEAGLESRQPDGVIRVARCFACGGETFRALPTPRRRIGPEVFGELEHRLGLTKCVNCRLVLVNPRPADDRLAVFYSGATYTCHETAGSASAGTKADYLLDILDKHLPATSARRAVLDFGAGGGGFMLHARARGWDVTGFEPGARGRNACLSAGLAVVDALDRLPRRHFNLITLHHVLEHLGDPIASLRALPQLLAPEGRLFIEVPNVASLRARLAVPALSQRFPIDERYRAFPIHLAYYSRRTLESVLVRAGWTVEVSITVGMGLDEFFMRSDETARPPNLVRGARVGHRRWGGVRRLIRDSFLALGLGENVAVIARTQSP